MLTVTIPAVNDGWDPVNEEFIQTKETTLQMEHSLLSISKWEGIWREPFMSFNEKHPMTYEQSLSYYKCMTITKNVPDVVFRAIPPEVVKQITAYINDTPTATTITHHGKQSKKQEIITAELIYFWMVSYQVPFECQKWHLNRLLTLLEVCSIKNNPDDKMSKKEALAHQKALNNARRAKYAASKRGGK